MKYFMYILKSDKKCTYYIGSTNNIEKRLVRHNLGDVKSTKRYIPWKLKYFESLETLKEARERELKVKSYKGGQAFKRLIGEVVPVAGLLSK
jgi:putative endonuclease